ncbi:sigma 54-interacting transcriptional regulator [Brevibacillus brevis]|uniref:HTH-type transcriptional regulatory protein TyrR n=1 Tax=Brevibacillus brevis TaxID=1393 RepID=A0ABY9SWR1_BREBE|nr:sigma 54-interacting transcriptional regulator [Brevibacillus brevis]WNC12256.1 sigma 54-interacting transcriptional regulator [Brevibacillus brevis]
MLVWKDILQPVSFLLPKESAVREALACLDASKAELLLVHEEQQGVVGYVDRHSLLRQIHASGSILGRIEYNKDMLKVPANSPITFYHNISVVLGIDPEGGIAGYIGTQEAKNQLSRYKLEQLNHIFNSSGIGMITTDSSFEITFMNETAEQILGLPKSVLQYRNYKTLLTLDKDLEEVLSGKQLLSVESSINYKRISGNFSPLYENGKMVGIVHIFSPRERLGEAVNELEFVRNLSDDLQAIYSQENEQILVVNPDGKIIRIAGTFLREFWGVDQPEQLIDNDVYQLEKAGTFYPNIADLCIAQRKKLSMIQESQNGRMVWSVATPVFHGERIEKVVILSRDVTGIHILRPELEIAPRKPKEHESELEDTLSKTDHHRKLIYRSREMERLVEELKHIAKVDSTVLLLGESGVGKEVFAQAIHDFSQRKREPFIRVNCGAIPENLVESELFGYEKGAFTGADQKGKPGMFELAHKGSIFLDEVTELPYSTQVKLLRVLQEREIMRVGGTRSLRVDVRVIVATNQNIRELVRQGRFREDLYYRLHVIPFEIPPLRKRPADIIPLAIHFCKYFNNMYGMEKVLTREALHALEGYAWPGNVRELQNMVERLIATVRADSIGAQDVLGNLYREECFARESRTVVLDIMPLKEAVEEVESQLISLALKKYGTASKVAKILGVSPATVSRRMQKRLQ